MAQTVVTTIDFEFQILSSSLEAMSNILTSYAVASSIHGTVPWPFVTLPSVEIDRHFETVHSLTKTRAIWMSPVVAEDDFWEMYVANITTADDPPTRDEIFGYSAVGVFPVSEEGPYAPVHQIYPSPPPIVPLANGTMAKYDMFSDPMANETYALVNQLKLTLMSGLLPMDIVRDAYPDVYDKEEPLSFIVQPVFKTFEDQTIVSYVQTVVEWKYVLSIMVKDDKSYFGFVKNTCGSNFTMKVVGGVASYEGEGDSHPKQYNDHAVAVVIRLSDKEEDLQAASEAGACIYTLTVYPTEELRATVNSRKKTTYTIIIFVIFMVMMATFFFYDR